MADDPRCPCRSGINYRDCHAPGHCFAYVPTSDAPVAVAVPGHISDALADVRYAADALNAAARSLAATPQGLRPNIDQSAIDALALKLKDSLSKSAEQEKLFYERWIRENPK